MKRLEAVMFRRKATVVVGALAVLAACVSANDPWKNADYEKWTSKEVEKILNNSPWAKGIQVPYYPYLNGDRAESDQHAKIGSASDPSGVADSQLYSPEGTFVLRWNTALTVRRALYREAVLHGEPDDYAARRYLINDEENIELTLIPTGQTLLPPVEPPSLIRETYLRLQPSGRKIPAINAESRSQVDARGSKGYIFYFPQKMADGTFYISRDITEIDFVSEVGVRRFEAKFRPAEMVGVGGADFY
jgi:hypothetical protein